MARAKAKDEMSGQAENGEGGDIEERKRVLRHASSLNRADVIKKVVHRSPQAQAAVDDGSPASQSSTSGGADDVELEVLNHVDEDGLTALHHAVRKSSLDAIRVLLRLGVNVSARGGEHSPYPGLTAYQVVLTGGAKGNPEEIKQVFLTEAVQAIAQGNAERLQGFIDAGLEPNSEYGTHGGDGGESNGSSSNNHESPSSLAGWAEQLGQSDMLAALTATTLGTTATAAPFGVDEGHDDFKGGGDGVGAVSGKRTAEGSGGSAADGGDAAMFVEQLREAITTLTAECDELESILTPRGTMGVIQRARAARQDVAVAEREVEAAKALCDRWRMEEDAAVAENRRLQGMVVDAQQAVELHRHKDTTTSPPAAVRPHAVATPSAPQDEEVAINPEAATVAAASQSPQHASNQRADGGGSASAAASDIEQQQDIAASADQSARSPIVGGASIATEGQGGDDHAADLRRKEEMTALSRSLQTIAMHLEDELQMMRALEGGQGAGGVVRRIRSLRAETEAAQDDARKAYSVARYLEARVIVLVEKGDELRAQLKRLQEYLSEPAGAANRTDGGGGGVVMRGPGKEDVEAFAAVAPTPNGVNRLEEGYRGPELDAFLGSEDEGGTPQRHRDDGGGSGGRDGLRGAAAGDEKTQEGSGGENRGLQPVKGENTAEEGDAREEGGIGMGRVGGNGAGGVVEQNLSLPIPPPSLHPGVAPVLQEIHAGEDDVRDAATGRGGVQQPRLLQQSPRRGHQEQESVEAKAGGDGGATREQNGAAAAVVAATPGSEQTESEPAALAPPLATADAGDVEPTASSAALSDSGGHESVDSSEEADVGGLLSAEEREERARALLKAPGVDAADGVRGWRRKRGGKRDDDLQPKVSVMQEVLSAVFGWDVGISGSHTSRGELGSAAVEKRAAAAAAAGRGPPGSSVMFA